MKKTYYILDARACGDNSPDSATVLEVCESLKEARMSAKEYGQCAIYADKLDNGRILEEIEWEEDYHENTI